MLKVLSPLLSMQSFLPIRRPAFLCLCLVLAGAGSGTADGPALLMPGIAASLTRSIPAEPASVLTGSQFAERIDKLDSGAREQAIEKEILAGHMPGFLRNLIPVTLSYTSPQGKSVHATIFTMPEYLAIGTDTNFLRIPMNLYTASAVARRLGFILPTRKMVDAIYAQSAFHYSPEPMTAGPEMRSTRYYVVHNGKVEAQSRSLGVTIGALVSGHKKDVVITNRLDHNPGRIAIYGWQRPGGAPIQPLSTVHGACYADYSHGIRLISETVLVDGAPRSVYDLLQDPALAGVLSDEGPMPNVRSLLSGAADQSCGQSQTAAVAGSATALPHPRLF